MPIDRRQMLMLMASASVAGLAAGDEADARTAQPSTGAASPAGSTGNSSAAAADAPTEKVLGIGGLFFRAHDPNALALWYRDHLGVALTPSDATMLPWQQEAGPTSFTPFPSGSKYFGAATQMWMVNFRVRDIEKMAAQLRSKGIQIDVDPTTYPYGRFARLHDPEGNPIELWQPAGHDAAH